MSYTGEPGEFILTVYGPFNFLNEEGENGPDVVPFIDYTEAMLQLGILDGTLTEGCFNKQRTKPPWVVDWPRPYQKLKTAYAEPFSGHNEPF